MNASEPQVTPRVAVNGVSKWVVCTRHAVKFPAGNEQAHREGPTGEQNTAGTCSFKEA